MAGPRPRRARRPRARRSPARGDPGDLDGPPAADAAAVQPRRLLVLRPGPAGARRAQPLRERRLRTARMVPDRRGPPLGRVAHALRAGVPDPAAGRGRGRRHACLRRCAAVPAHRPDRHRTDDRLPAPTGPRARDRPAEGRLAGPAQPPGPDALRRRSAQRRPDGRPDGGRPGAGRRAASGHRHRADRPGGRGQADRPRGAAVRRPALGGHPGQLAAADLGLGPGLGHRPGGVHAAVAGGRRGSGLGGLPEHPRDGAHLAVATHRPRDDRRQRRSTGSAWAPSTAR